MPERDDGLARVRAARRALMNLLEAGYKDEFVRLAVAISSRMGSSVMLSRIEAIQGLQTVNRNSAELAALQQTLSQIMRENARDVATVAARLEGRGIQVARETWRQLSFDDLAVYATRTGARFNEVAADTMRAAVNYSNSQAWQQAIELYTSAPAQLINNALITGVATGRSTAAVIEAIKVATDMASYQAETLTRTIYIFSYRAAAAEQQRANAALYVHQIRMAALDARTCMACVALHGKIYPTGEIIPDHYNGRCIGVPVLRFGSQPAIETGAAWFRRQTEDRQKLMMGPKRYELWQQGAFRIEEMARGTQDATFGAMVRVALVSELRSLGGPLIRP